jgi:hypothetical protein
MSSFHSVSSLVLLYMCPHTPRVRAQQRRPPITFPINVPRLSSCTLRKGHYLQKSPHNQLFQPQYLHEETSHQPSN